MECGCGPPKGSDVGEREASCKGCVRGIPGLSSIGTLEEFKKVVEVGRDVSTSTLTSEEWGEEWEGLKGTGEGSGGG